MAKASTSKFRLEPAKLAQIYDYMIRTRLLEERLIRMFKQNDGYFWLGGPGEEAFNIPLGMQIKKGQGLDHDFLHLHYRSLGILMPLGLQPKDPMRQMKNTALDPYSGGRNFAGHPANPAWNLVPTSSTIETQYLTAIGSAWAQRRHGGDGITIVNGGDAGTAEGDFASCMVWTNRQGKECPILIIVTNNSWGISTDTRKQHGSPDFAARAKGYGIENARVINGNDVEESWFAIQDAMAYIRKERKPAFIEARLSRLYGHSSATGANRVDEVDCLEIFEKQLSDAGVLTTQQMTEMKEKIYQEYLALSQEVRQEPMPDPSTIYDHIYFGQKGKYW